MNGDLTGESEEAKDAPIAPEAEPQNENGAEADAAASAEEPDRESLPAVLSGAALKEIRERREITLAAISSETKIGVRSLEALEEEAFEELPNARVYIRGFIRCYAEEVGIDPDRVESTYLPRWEAWAEEEKERAIPKFPGSAT